MPLYRVIMMGLLTATPVLAQPIIIPLQHQEETRAPAASAPPVAPPIAPPTISRRRDPPKPATDSPVSTPEPAETPASE